MTHSIPTNPFRLAARGLAFCLVALLALPVQAQETDNMTILGNFGKGDGESRTVFALGSRAYYGVGSKVEISDFTNASSPVVLGSATVPDRVEDVITIGNTMYVGSGDGLHIFNVQNPTAISELSTEATESYLEGIAVDPPYVLMGDGSAGLRILDATDPANPSSVSQVDTLGYVEGISYGAGIAYVSAGSRIHMIDYSDPAAPTYAGRIDAPLDYYQSATVRGSYLYVADFFGGFRIFDVSDPANPVDVGYFDPADRTARVALDGDYAYLANGDKGVSIIDISDPASPSEVVVIDTPVRALQAAISGTLLFIADTEGIQVYDVSTPATPVFASSIDVNAPAEGKAFGINLDGDHAFVAYGDAGLRVLDITNPSNLTQVVQVDIRNDSDEGQARQVVVSGSYAYVASRSAGVQIVDISDLENASVVGNIDISDAGDVAVDDTVLVVAGGSGITILSISDPLNPMQLFASDGLGYADRVGVSGSYAYAITTGSNIRVFDMTDPDNIALAGTVETGGDYSEGRMTIVGDHVFTTNGDFIAASVASPATPVLVGTYDAPSYSYSANVDGNFAYVATEREGIRLVDISDPANPTEVGFAKPGDEMRDVVIRDGVAFTANGDAGVTVIQNDLPTSVEGEVAVPQSVALLQNYPNPFSESTEIQFALEEAGVVSIEVYNVLGQKVTTVLNERRGAGQHSVSFRADGLANGTYFYQIQSGDERASRRMVIVK